MKYIKIINWDMYQHYKDRNPPWIKLHQDLLSSEAWVMGNDEQKLLLIVIMTLAARFDNNIPNNPQYLRRVANIDTEPNLSWLVEVGFCEWAAEQTLRESPWPSRHIPKDIKEAILSEEKACKHCGSTEKLEIDHIIPVSKGGESIRSNLQVLCRSCNRKKRVSVADATQDNELRSLETEERESRGEKRKTSISSIEELERHSLDGHYAEWFSEKASSVNRFNLRDEMVLYCRAKGKTYKDYWSALQKWALKKQSEAPPKPDRKVQDENWAMLQAIHGRAQ